MKYRYFILAIILISSCIVDKGSLSSDFHSCLMAEEPELVGLYNQMWDELNDIYDDQNLIIELLLSVQKEETIPENLSYKIVKELEKNSRVSFLLSCSLCNKKLLAEKKGNLSESYSAFRFVLEKMFLQGGLNVNTVKEDMLKINEKDFENFSPFYMYLIFESIKHNENKGSSERKMLSSGSLN